MLAAVKDLLNQCWARRDTIQPVTTTRRIPRPLDVWTLLPQTNCKQCGQPTCFTFALKLVAGQQKLEECPPLWEPAFADQLARLQAILIDAPAIG
ncbi:MAG: (Fe-S)-binding protein [Chloroflexota bacterium]